MDKKKLPKDSQGGLIDNTNPTGLDRFFDALLVKLNPVYAVRNARQKMIERGDIEIPGAEAWAEQANAQGDKIIAQVNAQESREQLPMNGLTPEEMTVILERERRKTIRNRR